jgi:hypothetical protein
MTGYTVHTGSNQNFREGWDRVFGKGKKKTKATKPEQTKKKSGRKSR